MATVDVALSVLLVGGSVAVIVLAVVLLARSRDGETAGLFGRAVHRPRLLAAAGVCGGISGLLFEAQEHMPGSWQGPGLSTLVSALELTFLVLLFTHLGSQLRARRSR
jgi:hypothetical protein